MKDRTREESALTNTEDSLGRCLVDGDAATNSIGRRMRRRALGMSFTIEVAALALLVVSPLLSGIAQPQLHNLPPMPIVMGVWNSHRTNRAATNTTPHSMRPSANPISRFVFPELHAKIRDHAEQSKNAFTDPPGENFSDTILIPRSGEGSAKFEPPHVDRPVTQEKQTMKVSEGVQQAQLVSRIEPQYPVLARQTRTQGTVFLRAIISREGRITALEVLSGPPLLVQAALNAVRQWRYRPTMLNGEPVEVETSITVVFRFSD